MSKIKAILFDMDGVLVDAKEWHYEALNRALKLFGMEITRYEHITNYDGLPTSKKLQMLSLERNLPNELHDFIAKLKQTYTMELVYTRCKPVFNVQYTLSKLKGEGYRLAVCSNAVKSSVKMMIERSQLSEFVDFSLSNEDVKKPKPDPEIYLTTMKMFDLSPKECLILEDNQNGIMAAKASGAHLLKVDNVGDVTYYNIKTEISRIEKELC